MHLSRAALVGDQVQGMALGENLCSMVDKVIGLREKYRTQRPEYRMFTHMDTLSEEKARPGREEIL